MGSQHVIVGSGIAGLAAAETIRQRQPQATISMISEERHEFYSRPGLAYLLRGDLREKQLFIRTRQDLQSLQLQRLHARVEQLDCAAHELTLTDGRRVTFDRLLLATGALAVAPSFLGGDLSGVVTLDGLDDTRRIIALAKRTKSAVVIGGGITALELVEGLTARRVQVHYFLRGQRYWSDVLDEIESDIVLSRLRHEGVKIHLNTQIDRAQGADGKLVAVETQAGARIACQMLAVAIGVRPRVDLARQAGLRVDRGVVVDPYLQTSQPDVFAAGDVAEIFDPQQGRGSLDVLWPSALAQGNIAGANMTGAGLTYRKTSALNVTQLTGLRTTIIGAVGAGKNDDLVAITRGESESWRALPSTWVLSQRDDVNRLRLMAGERTIVGAVVMGDQTWSRPLQRLIVEKVDISPVCAALMQPTDGLAALAAFYHHWSTHAQPGL